MVQFTIIIPTYNREKQITSLLSGINILNENTPPFEVVVVDDGSLPPLKVQKSEYNYPLTLLCQENSGPAQARNTGAEIARGEFLVFIDDDCSPDADWLINYQKSCNKNPELLLGGYTSNGLEENPYSHTTQMLVDFLLDHYSPQEHLGGFFPTNNMLVPKLMFLALGGFNPSVYFGEDREFCYRWVLKGHNFAHVKGAKVSHSHSLNFLSFLKLHFRYGSGTYHFRRLANKIQKPIPYSGLKFYLQLIFSPFQQYTIPRGVLYALLLFCSHGANAVGIFFEYFKTSLLFRKRLT